MKRILLATAAVFMIGGTDTSFAASVTYTFK